MLYLIKESDDAIREFKNLRINANSGQLTMEEVQAHAKDIFIAYKKAKEESKSWGYEKVLKLIASYIDWDSAKKIHLNNLLRGEFEEEKKKEFIKRLICPTDILIFSAIAEETGNTFFLPKPAPSKEELEKQQAKIRAEREAETLALQQKLLQEASLKNAQLQVEQEKAKLEIEKKKAELTLKEQQLQHEQLHQQYEAITMTVVETLEEKAARLEQQYQNLMFNRELLEYQKQSDAVKRYPNFLDQINESIQLIDKNLDSIKKELDIKLAEQTLLFREQLESLHQQVDSLSKQESCHFVEVEHKIQALKEIMQQTASENKQAVLKDINLLEQKLNELSLEQNSIISGVKEEIQALFQSSVGQGKILSEQTKKLNSIEEMLIEESKKTEKKLNTALTDCNSQLAKLEGLPESITKIIAQLNDLNASLSDESIIRERFEKLKKSSLSEPLSDIYIQAMVGNGKEKHLSLTQSAQAFLESNKKVFLILGESGQGKSTFGKRLIRGLWENYTNKAIPLFISLPAIGDPKADILEKYLRDELKFTKSQILKLKNNYSFTLFLDAYDEVRGFPHYLFLANGLYQWQLDKVFITCRTNSHYLTRGENDFSTFHPMDKGKNFQKALFESVTLKPFNEMQILSYIKQYVTQPDAVWQDWRSYTQYFEHFPEIKQLISNPFLLEITTKVLPKLVQEHGGIGLKPSASGLREAFVKDWFERSLKKFAIQRKTFKNGDSITLEDLENFSMALAEEMKNSQVPAVQYKPVNRRMRSYSDELSDEEAVDTSKWEKFFGEDEDVTLLREGCPLITVGQHEYAFLHKSLLEYFASKKRHKLILEASRQKSKLKSLMKKLDDPQLLTRPEELVKGISELIAQDQECHKICYEIIEHSKKGESNPIASANAMTILNHVGYSFAGKSLAGIRAHSAILEGGNFDSVDFSEADLSQTILRHACLDNTSFKNAILTGVDFGAKPSLMGHESTVLAISSTKEGHFIASTSKDKTIRLWDLKKDTTDILHTQSHSAYTISFSPDYKWLAWGDSARRVTLYELESKESVRLQGHSGEVLQIVFDSEQQLLASAGKDQTIRLWDLISKTCIQTINTSHRRIHALRFSPDGSYLAAGGEDGKISLWSIATGNMLAELIHHTSTITSLSFSRDGRWLASGSGDTTIAVWDMYSKSHYISLKEHNHQVKKVLFLDYAGEGAYVLASASFDGVVCIWDLSEEHFLQQKFIASEGEINDLDYYLDEDKGGVVLLVAGRDLSIHRFELGGYFAKQNTHKSDVTCLSLSPSGTKLVSGSYDQSLLLWNAADGKLIKRFRGHESWIAQACFSPDGNKLASCGWENNIYIWDAQGKETEPLQILEAHSDYVLSLCFSSDGKYLLSTDRSQMDNVFLWDLEKGTVIQKFAGHTNSVSSCRFARNDELVLTGSHDNSVRLWERKTGKLLKTFSEQTEAIRAIDILSDGELIASAAGDKTICLWDPKTGASVKLLGHTDTIESIRFSSDGQWLVSSSKDKTIKIWDTQRATLVTQIEAHKKGATAALFSSDAQSVYTAGRDMAVKAWHLKTVNEGLRLMLSWTSNPIFSCKGADFSEAKGLSQDTLKLLKQHGAIVPMPAATRSPNSSAQRSPRFWGTQSTQQSDQEPRSTHFLSPN